MAISCQISIPLILRVFEWIFCLITFSTAAGGMGGIINDLPVLGSGSGSVSSFRFMIFTGVFGWLTVTIWIVAFHVFKRKLPHPTMGIIYDVVMTIFTFCAAIAAAASDLNSNACGLEDLKDMLQKILGRQCSTLRVSIAWCFFTCFFWIGSVFYSVRLYRIEMKEDAYSKAGSGKLTSAQLSEAAKTGGASALPPGSAWDTDGKPDDNDNFI